MENKSILIKIANVMNDLENNKSYRESDLIYKFITKAIRTSSFMENIFPSLRVAEYQSNWQYKDYIESYKQAYQDYIEGKTTAQTATDLFNLFMKNPRFTENQKQAFRNQAETIRRTIEENNRKKLEQKRQLDLQKYNRYIQLQNKAAQDVNSMTNAELFELAKYKQDLIDKRQYK